MDSLPSGVIPAPTNTLVTSVQHVHTLATRTDGFKTIAEIAAGIFELIAFLAKDVPVALTNFAITLNHTIGMLTIMSLVKRLNTFVCPNDEGKMLWERDTVTAGALNVVGQTGLTLFNVSFFARFLNGAGVITLGKIAAPLSAVGGVGLGVAASLDICDLTTKLVSEIPSTRMRIGHEKSFFEKRKITQQHERDEKLASASSSLQHSGQPSASSSSSSSVGPTSPIFEKMQYINRRIASLTQKLSTLEQASQKNTQQYSEVFSRLQKWHAISKMSDLPAMQNDLWNKFCQNKIQKAEDKLANLDNAQKRTIANLLFDITVVALVVFSLLLPAAISATVAVSVIILGIANSMFELSTNVLDFCIQDKVIKHVKVPVFIPSYPIPQPSGKPT
jgi:hypothetical protein